MEELFCVECQRHVGWIVDCGPHGMVYCDECYRTEQEAEAQEEENRNCFSCGQDSCGQDSCNCDLAGR